MPGRIDPLYVVCSPCRCVGKTLVARLLAEFHLLGDRAVTAFDLADEGPQLTDYLPDITTIADIGETQGQMAFFDRLVAKNDGVRVIDVSHRAFKRFFEVAQQIGFFEETRRRSVAPLILFIVDQDPKAAEAYASLRRSCTSASLLPVRNQGEVKALPDYVLSPDTWIAPASLDIAALGFSLRAAIDRPAFSFAQHWQAKPDGLPPALDDELQDWTEGVFLQFAALERFLAGDQTAAPLEPPRPRRPRLVRRPNEVQPVAKDHTKERTKQLTTEGAVGVPEQVLKFAPKKVRGEDSDAMDHSGDAIVTRLQEAAGQLRAAEDRIDQLETELKQTHDRAVRAETWLQVIKEEIEARLITPTVATIPKSMT
jgi:hypothetical protein